MYKLCLWVNKYKKNDVIFCSKEIFISPFRMQMNELNVSWESMKFNVFSKSKLVFLLTLSKKIYFYLPIIIFPSFLRSSVVYLYTYFSSRPPIFLNKSFVAFPSLSVIHTPLFALFVTKVNGITFQPHVLLKMYLCISFTTVFFN